MITGRTEVRVRYAETDMMGIAYHGNYLPWLEIGRTELLRQHGLPYAELEASKNASGNTTPAHSQ